MKPRTREAEERFARSVFIWPDSESASAMTNFVAAGFREAAAAWNLPTS